MKTIGIDAREIQDGVVTGIGRSLINCIRHFAKAYPRHSLVLFSEKNICCDLPNIVKKVVISPCLTVIWDQWRLPWAIAKAKVDLFYSPYYKVPLLCPVPVVGQVLDLMYLAFPPYKKSLGLLSRLYYAIAGRAFSRKSVSIITDSQHAKGDIRRIWKVPESKLQVIPLGVGERYGPVADRDVQEKTRHRYNLPKKFVLYLGNFKLHKNVETLVKAFKRIENRFPDYRLVLAGPLDVHGRRIQDFVRKIDMIGSVIFTDTIREEDRPEALLTLAELFVFPSLYEGFGLPPLEAMACGTPVIAANATSIPEVVGDAGLLFDPYNDESLSNNMEKILADGDMRKLYSQRGLEHARYFSEEMTASLLCKHLLQLAGEIL